SFDEPHDVPLLSFTGDTRVEVLERTSELQHTETLILEASFLDERVSVANARALGHVHLEELLARLELLPETDVVLCHFSARYDAQEIEEILDARLPGHVRARVRMLRV